MSATVQLGVLRQQKHKYKLKLRVTTIKLGLKVQSIDVTFQMRIGDLKFVLLLLQVRESSRSLKKTRIGEAGRSWLELAEATDKQG